MTEELQLIISDFTKSVNRLKESLAQPKSILARDASIKRFELTFELCWKALKEYLKDQGVVCHSPKSCLQEAFREGVVNDNGLWVDMINDRNSSVHTYSDAFAQALYKRLPKYLDLFVELEKGLV